MSPTVFLVTGANRGVGLGLAQALLEHDASNIVVATAREPSKAEDLQKLAQTYEGRLEIVKMDVGDLESVKAAGQVVKSLEVVKEHGIDVLANNAGVSIGALEVASEISLGALDVNLRTNLYGPIFVTQEFIGEVEKSNLKRVVYHSSYAGSFGCKVQGLRPGDLGAYSISKSAANQFFLRLSMEYESRGVKVINLHPGLVDTPMMAGMPDVTLLSPHKAGQLWIQNILVNTPKESISYVNELGESIPW